MSLLCSKCSKDFPISIRIKTSPSQCAPAFQPLPLWPQALLPTSPTCGHTGPFSAPPISQAHCLRPLSLCAVCLGSPPQGITPLTPLLLASLSSNAAFLVRPPWTHFLRLFSVPVPWHMQSFLLGPVSVPLGCQPLLCQNISFFIMLFCVYPFHTEKNVIISSRAGVLVFLVTNVTHS